jgi:hypothetical protein
MNTAATGAAAGGTVGGAGVPPWLHDIFLGWALHYFKDYCFNFLAHNTTIPTYFQVRLWHDYCSMIVVPHMRL